ncbi:MAG: RNA methyltransferase [Lentisphaerae bacterium]|nr:RNA methyltransferase [Lentisphaerota bacterium]
MPPIITSATNEQIKQIIRLAKAGERRKRNLFVIEGQKETAMAINAGFEIVSLFYCNSLARKESLLHMIKNAPASCQLYEVNAAVFEKIAYRERSDGLVALAVPKYGKPDEIPLPPKPFIIVIESVEKPGNLGAILRTADAAGVNAVFVCDAQTDIYNPNVVRSSVGCVFSCNIALCESHEAMEFFHKKHIRTYAACLNAKKSCYDVDFTGASAVIMGSEADGLSNVWLNESDTLVKIPMRGKADSLNVSVSTAILAYEAMRQRGLTKKIQRK